MATPRFLRSDILQPSGCSVLERIEELIGKIETCPDPGVREMARHLVQAILSLNSEAFGRVLEIAGKEVGGAFVDRLAADPKVAPLLLLYGLHPEEVRSRVERALEDVRPYLNSHGGSVELLGVEVEPGLGFGGRAPSGTKIRRTLGDALARLRSRAELGYGLQVRVHVFVLPARCSEYPRLHSFPQDWLCPSA